MTNGIVKKIRTPENGRGTDVLAQTVEGKGGNDGTGLAASSGHTVSSGTELGGEELGGIALLSTCSDTCSS